MNAVLLAIKADPGWTDGRFLAPAGSRHAGCIIDLSINGVGIAYRTLKQGREVEIIDIFPFFVG